MKRLSDFAFAIGIYSIFVTSPAQAYLDGATISIILQALTGAVASVLLFGKVYIARFFSFFSFFNFRRARPSAPAVGDSREA